MERKLPDYYKILGVARNADNKDIERAFRKKAMQCHPDRFPDPKQKEAKTREFQELNAAYTLLSHYIRRKDYDAALKRQEEAEQNNQADSRYDYSNDDTGNYEYYESPEERELKNAIQCINNFISKFETPTRCGSIVYNFMRFGNLTHQKLKNVLASGNPTAIKEVARNLQPYTDNGAFMNSFDTEGKECSFSVRYTFADFPDIIANIIYTKIMVRRYKWKGTFSNGKQTEIYTGIGNDWQEVVTDGEQFYCRWLDPLLIKKACDAAARELDKQYTYTTATSSCQSCSQISDTMNNRVNAIIACGFFLFGTIVYLFVGFCVVASSAFFQIICFILAGISLCLVIMFAIFAFRGDISFGSDSEYDNDNWESDI